MDFKTLEKDPEKIEQELKMLEKDIKMLEKDPEMEVFFENAPGIKIQFSHAWKGYHVWKINEEHTLFLMGDTDPCDYRSRFMFMPFYYEKKAYAKACGKISRKLNIPFGVVLALGPELSREYYVLVKKLAVQKKELREVEHVLGLCGIERRKKMIHRLLNDESEDLYYKVESMGQEHSSRVARDLLEIYITKVRLM